MTAAAASGDNSSGDSRPNFLFIFTDDQRWDAMGVVQHEQGEQARFPWFKTPSMDRLAAEGARFRNAFVTNSLCSPSRAVFLTGRYNHLNGVANNQVPFPEDNVSFATVLRENGYQTTYIGKWHMDRQRAPRPGFDYSASYTGQGAYNDATFVIDGKDTPIEGFTDDAATDVAIDFLQRKHDRPFAMVVGFKSAHVPFTPPERARERFVGEEARPAPNLQSKAVYIPEPSDTASNGRRGPWWNRDGPNLAYFQLLSGADDNLGRILDALDETALAENTMVVYSSDNGFYLGEHGLADKRSAYDESMRIPLLVRYPRLIPPGAVRDEMVLNLDLAPTLLELAGVTVPAEMQGRSWKPLFAKNTGTWRDAFLYQYFWEAKFPNTPTLVAVRTDHAKLVIYPGHPEWTEVFDLSSDPYEMANLVRDPTRKALVENLEGRLVDLIEDVQYRIPPYADKP